jgi:hypothetical protein
MGMPTRLLLCLLALACAAAFTVSAGATPSAKKRCHPSYKLKCLDPDASDYD